MDPRRLGMDGRLDEHHDAEPVLRGPRSGLSHG